MKHIINFSGGICSLWNAVRCKERHGTKDMVLLFADVLIEDAELYIFNEQCAKYLGVPITRISREITPFELFEQKGMIGNSRFPICSVILKRELLDEWHRANALEMDSILYIGFDWEELGRLQAIRTAKPEWRIEALMTEEPIWDKCRMIAETELLGIIVPRLYRLGFPHNNCGGGCVQAGKTHWIHLLEVLPDVYAKWEADELKCQQVMKDRGVSNWEFTILKDRRNGGKKSMTLRELRLRYESGERFSKYDWGSCGCGKEYENQTTNPLRVVKA